MELTNQIILLGGALLLLSVFASLISARVGMPLLLVFLVLGMLIGEEGVGGVQFHDVQTAHLIGSLALAIILFDGGLRTEVRSFRVGLRPAVVLATVGVLLTALITGLFAAWVLDLHWMVGLLIGAIVASTDAAAVFSLLHSHGLELKQRVGATLEIESGSNDPMAIFLTVALVELLAAGHTTLHWTVLGDFVLQMGVGALAGLAGGYLLAAVINRLTLSPGLYPLAVLAGALLIFGVATLADGSGFLAVYLAGLLMGNRRLQAGQNIRRFHDGMAWLSQITMFVMLGLLVTPSDLLATAVPALLVAAVLILVARPVAVGVSLLPFRFPWREQVFISWVGLRGAVPIILALFPLLAGLEQASVFFNMAFFVVLISLLVQGWTIAPAARLLGLEVPPGSGAIQRVELDIPGQQDLELVGYRLEPEARAVGRAVQRLVLPAGARVAAVIRDGRPVQVCEPERLQAKDYVYLLAQRDDVTALDRLFGTVHAPERLEERVFFGEFVLDGDAHLADLALAYGVDIPPEAGETTLADYLTHELNGRQVIGDRVRLGKVVLVVRDTEGARITKVGLKLSA